MTTRREFLVSATTAVAFALVGTGIKAQLVDTLMVNGRSGRLKLPPTTYRPDDVVFFKWYNIDLSPSDMVIMRLVGGMGDANYLMQVTDIYSGEALIGIKNLGPEERSAPLVIEWVIIESLGV